MKQMTFSKAVMLMTPHYKYIYSKQSLHYLENMELELQS